jgi:hypothetical protein
MKKSRYKASAGIVVASALWLGVVLGGTIGMTRYANTPGGSGGAPMRWPEESQIPVDANLPTLIMFAHPRCPCTRASMGELEVLLAQFPGKLSAHVVFLKSADTVADWEKADLWRTASSIPGVVVHTDEAGIEARRFRAETSGQTLLYDRSGTLQFQGGITLSRGHAGDNAGRSALQELLRGEHPGEVRTPVFGCSLFEAICQKGGDVCKP